MLDRVKWAWNNDAFQPAAIFLNPSKKIHATMIQKW